MSALPVTTRCGRIYVLQEPNLPIDHVLGIGRSDITTAAFGQSSTVVISNYSNEMFGKNDHSVIRLARVKHDPLVPLG
jgi:hypothetical protein